MTNTYKALSDVGEHYFGKGVVEADLSPAEEQDALGGGHLEIVPRKYRVLSDNYEAGKQGDVVDLALLVEHESALLQGGHIERVDKPATKQKKED
jgi:hypothetical protein